MRNIAAALCIASVGLLILVAVPGHARVRVVASLPTLGALAAEIGGEHVSAQVLAASSEDPHYVDPRPSLIVVLNRADLLIVNGLELEKGWLPPLQSQARNAAIQTGGSGYLDSSLGVTALEVPAGKVDRAMGDIHPGGNPHHLFDARSLAGVAEMIGDRLAQLDPERADYFRLRSRDLARELRLLAAASAKRFAGLPESRRRVVSYHRSFVYLYDWLGLEEVATIEPKPGIPPDPGHVAGVLGTIRTSGAGVIIQEEFHPRSTGQTLARLSGIRTVIVPAGVRFENNQKVVEHLGALVEEIYHALAH
jgi:zinc/manganese transport system substrate-binding protein